MAGLWIWRVALLLATPLGLFVCAGPSSTSTINHECLNSFWPALTSQCRAHGQASQQGESGSDLSDILRQIISSCLPDASVERQRVAYLFAPQLGFVSALSSSIRAVLQTPSVRSSNLSVSMQFASFTDWANVLLGFAQQRNTTYLYNNMTGFIMDNLALPDLNNNLVMADITALVQKDSVLQWSGIHSFYRSTVITERGLIQAVPLGGVVYQLYYRADVLDAANLTVPNTWDDLLAAAAIVHGQDMDGDGVGDAGVCLMRAPGCFGGFNLAAIWTSYIQSQGSSQGAFFNPVTMEPLLGTVAMQRAMEIYLGLKQYGHPEESTLCYPVNLPFLKGQCAFTIAWGGQYKANSLSPDSRVSMTARVAMLPGSTQVLNRTTNTLEPCTPATCKLAAQELTGIGPGATLALVNRAPYLPLGSVSAGVSSSSPYQLQELLFQVYARAAGPINSWQLVMDPLSEIGPFRNDHFDPDNLGRWTRQGYSRNLTASYLNNVLSIIEHPNLVIEARIPVYPNTSSVRTIFTSAGASLDANTTTLADIPGIIQLMVAKVQESYGSAVPGFSRLRDMYRFGVGYVEPSPPPPPPPQPYPPELAAVPEDSTDRLSFSSMMGIIVGTVLGFALLLFLGLLLAYHAAAGARASRLNWQAQTPSGPLSRFLQKFLLPHMLAGPVPPPGKGPDTTLIVTDVEKSTELWEAIEAHVMDQVWSLHHNCMRLYAAKYCGYESQTEGDSFIIGFPGAAPAMNFCMDAQKALAELDWPLPLLEHPLCAAVWAKPVRSSKLPMTGRMSSVNMRGGAVLASRHSLPDYDRVHSPSSTLAKCKDAFSHAFAHSHLRHVGDSPRAAKAHPEDGLGPADSGLDHDYEANDSSIGPPIQGLPSYLQGSVIASPASPAGTDGTLAPGGDWMSFRAPSARPLPNVPSADSLTFKPELSPMPPSKLQLAVTAAAAAADPSIASLPSQEAVAITQRASVSSSQLPARASIRRGASFISRQASEVQLRSSRISAFSAAGNAAKPSNGGTSMLSEGQTTRSSGLMVPVDLSSAGDLSKHPSYRNPGFPEVQLSHSSSREKPRTGSPGTNAPFLPGLLSYIRKSMARHSGDELEAEDGPHPLPTTFFHRTSIQTLATDEGSGAVVQRSTKSISCAGPPAVRDWGSPREDRSVRGMRRISTQRGPEGASGSHGIMGTERSSTTTKQTSVMSGLSSRTHQYSISKEPATWTSFQKVLHNMWQPCTAGTAGAVLVWRGLRVRMGGATGMHADSDLIYNEASGRLKYTGVFLDLAKSISHVAHGGQVVVADATRLQLPPNFMQEVRKCCMMYMGEFLVENSGRQQVSLHWVGKKWSLSRLIESQPLRAVRLSFGTLDAPTGDVSAALISIVSRQHLVMSGGRVAQEVLDTFDAMVLVCTHRHNGYLVQGTDPAPGRARAVFSCAFSAISWALDMQQGLMWHSWSQHVLKDTHCAVIHSDGTSSEPIARVVFRGPRVKAAVVHGGVQWSLNPSTGRLHYHGNLIKQLSQLQSAALTGMIVVSRPAGYQAEFNSAVRVLDEAAPGFLRVLATHSHQPPSQTASPRVASSVLQTPVHSNANSATHSTVPHKPQHGSSMQALARRNLSITHSVHSLSQDPMQSTSNPLSRLPEGVALWTHDHVSGRAPSDSAAAALASQDSDCDKFGDSAAPQHLSAPVHSPGNSTRMLEIQPAPRGDLVVPSMRSPTKVSRSHATLVVSEDGSRSRQLASHQSAGPSSQHSFMSIKFGKNSLGEDDKGPTRLLQSSTSVGGQQHVGQLDLFQRVGGPRAAGKPPLGLSPRMDSRCAPRQDSLRIPVGPDSITAVRPDTQTRRPDEAAYKSQPLHAIMQRETLISRNSSQNFPASVEGQLTESSYTVDEVHNSRGYELPPQAASLAPLCTQPDIRLINSTPGAATARPSPPLSPDTLQLLPAALRPPLAAPLTYAATVPLSRTLAAPPPHPRARPRPRGSAPPAPARSQHSQHFH